VSFPACSYKNSSRNRPCAHCVKPVQRALEPVREGRKEVVDQKRVATKSRALIILSKHFRGQLSTQRNDTTFIRKEKNQAKKAVAPCISGCHVVFPLLHSPPLPPPPQNAFKSGEERAGMTTLPAHRACRPIVATQGNNRESCGLVAVSPSGLLLASSHSLLPSLSHPPADAFVVAF